MTVAVGGAALFFVSKPVKTRGYRSKVGTQRAGSRQRSTRFICHNTAAELEQRRRAPGLHSARRLSRLRRTLVNYNNSTSRGIVEGILIGGNNGNKLGPASVSSRPPESNASGESPILF